MKRLLIAAMLCGLSAAQQAEPPSFDAASVKRSDAAPGSSGINTTPGRLHAYNATLRRCIRGAYGISEVQIFGGPKWLDEDRFDIVAVAGGGVGDQQLAMMLRRLLADRFKLVLHTETRMMPGYALTLAKGGLKVKPSDADAAASTNTTRGRMEAKACTLPYFAMRLSSSLGIPIQDATGVAGAFDIVLEWQPDELRAPAAGVDAKPSIFEAVQTQLGLRLESRKLPVEAIVIDRAEHPTQN